MTTGRPVTAGSRPADCGIALPLAFWSFVQVSVLAVAAVDLPLVLSQAQPTERWAVPLLSGVQIGVTALFAGRLLGSVSNATFSIALVWPLLQLAGLLGGEPQWHILATSGAVTLWLSALACWMAAMPHSARPIVSALASAWTLGGAALAYCHADFGSRPGESVFPTAAGLSPLLDVVWVSTDPSHWGPWIVSAIHCCLATTVLVIARLRRSPTRA